MVNRQLLFGLGLMECLNKLHVGVLWIMVVAVAAVLTNFATYLVLMAGKVHFDGVGCELRHFGKVNGLVCM